MHIYRGLITEVDKNTVKAKAKLPDLDDIETDWLPVPQIWTHQAKAFHLPRIGQQTYIFFLDDEHLDGFILGGRYSDKDKPPAPPEITPDDLYFCLEDGTKLRLSKNLIDLYTPGHIKATAEGNITAEAAGNINATAGGSATLKAGTITLDATTVTITGALTVQSTIDATDIITAPDATLAGKIFSAHKHTSAPSGSPTTPPI